MSAARISRDAMLAAMHDDLRGTSAAKSKRADTLARANGFTQYEIAGKALPKKHAA